VCSVDFGSSAMIVVDDDSELLLIIGKGTLSWIPETNLNKVRNSSATAKRAL
ncbi:hypothetical protein Tco_1422892, partial [Tanacetum coccineum]